MMRPDSTHRIGTVAAVESENVVVEIDPAATGFVKAGSAGILPIGAVNSYITIAAGSARVIAVVTAIRMREDVRPIVRESGPVDANSGISRTIEATMVGRLEGSAYEPGLTTYPSVFAPVFAATRVDLEAVFRPAEPCFRFGEAVVAPDQDVWLHADRLLGRHFAILGTTGSGKSCSVMAILDGLLQLEVPNANIIIFDTNGEYSPCFTAGSERAAKARAFTMGPEPGSSGALFLPHWFMNSAEYLELLRAAEGIQAPLLQRAVSDARIASQHSGDSLLELRVIRRVVGTIELIERTGRKIQHQLLGQFKDLFRVLKSYQDRGGRLSAIWTQMSEELRSVKDLKLDSDPNNWNALTASQQDLFQRILVELKASLREAVDSLGLGSALAAQDFDAPSHYSMEDLAEIFLPQRIALEAEQDARIASFAVSMQLRLSRLLADERYSFMTRVEPFEDALALYLRLLFGKEPTPDDGSAEEAPWLAFYESMTGDGDGHVVTILDLSLVSHDVLNVVTALIARLVLELAQRLEPRGLLPTLVLLEEAHRYVRRDKEGGRSQAGVAFERIAKEGRKFGISLGLATQRPSELDPTVLSQCGTIIAHRTVSKVDQDLIRNATPLSSRDVLRQLPGLATQHALVLGEAAPAPVAARVRRVLNPPDSHDPEYISSWREQPSARAGELITEAARSWEKGERRRIRWGTEVNGGAEDEE